MFMPAAAAFLAVPDVDDRRVLVEGTVSLCGHGACVVGFDAPTRLAAGGDATLYADRRGKFFQQAAVFTSEIALDDGRWAATFALVGEPVSAEQRGSFRTSAVTLNVPVAVDRVAGCVLADVGPEGVGVITPKPLVCGASVDVSVAVDGFVVSDRMRVQAAKILPDGRLRYGLYVPAKTSPTRRTLEKLTGHLQRVQLRRLSGAA